MNREILFRARRVDNGEWTQGYFFQIWERTFILWGTTNDIPNMIEVDPSTVGQYTGLTDKNGKRVFEGDVISLVTADYEPITIECRFGKVQRQIYENLVEITGFYFVRSNDGRKTFPIVHNYLGKHDAELYEVIGTIYDEAET